MQFIDWHAIYVNMLHLGASDLVVTLAEKMFRPVAVYLLLVLALRVFGKRILAQLNPFDLVVLLMLSNSVQNAIIGNDTSLTGGVIGAMALLGINAVLVRLFYRGPAAEHQMLEDDIYLIRDHALQEDTMRRLRINVGELTARAHERGFDDLRGVKDAVLYSNGTIYMKGGASADDVRYDEILRELKALRQALAAQGR